MATKNIGVVMTAMREEIAAHTTMEAKIAHKAAGSTSHSTSDPRSGRTGLAPAPPHELALLQQGQYRGQPGGRYGRTPCRRWHRDGLEAREATGTTHPPTSWSLPRCWAPPADACLLDVLGHGVVEGAEEASGPDRPREVVALHLVAHRILQFGKDQRHATLVQPGVQLPQRVGGRDVDV